MKRREFLEHLPAAGGILLQGRSRKRTRPLIRHAPRGAALGPRIPRPDPYRSGDGRPRLVCIEGVDIALMLRKGLAAMGGLEPLIPGRQGVLIKPNLVLREPAGIPDYPTMSSPDTIRELIHLVRTLSDDVMVGDQGGEDQAAIYEDLDLPNAVMGAGARLIDFEREADPVRAVRLPEWGSVGPDYHVFGTIHRASVILSLCNLKRHSSAYMTGAIKNMFGALEGRWNSGTRGWVHRFPNYSREFIESLPDVWALIRPELTIVDARHIMVGNGPLLSSPGAEIRTGVSRLVLGADPVAVDAYCARRILAPRDPSFDPDTISPMLSRAESLGLGTADLDAVEIREIDESWVGGSKRGPHRR